MTILSWSKVQLLKCQSKLMHRKMMNWLSVNCILFYQSGTDCSKTSLWVDDKRSDIASILSKKLSEKSQEVYENLSKKFMCDYDEAGSIGKRYRREDEIGTPYCVTIDFDTLEDNKVTIRDRDTMEQVRIDISEIENWLQEKIEF